MTSKNTVNICSAIGMNIIWILSILLVIGLAIVAYIIAIQNWTACHESRLSLPIWLVINTSVMTVYVSITCTMEIVHTIIYLIFDSDLRILKMIHWALTSPLYCAFLCYWNIIGGLTLFNDTSDCYENAKPLWIMSMIAFVFNCVGIYCYICNYFIISHFIKNTHLDSYIIYEIEQ